MITLDNWKQLSGVFFCSRLKRREQDEDGDKEEQKNMGYSSGMMKDRVEILRKVQTAGKIGKSSGAAGFESLGCVWAQVAFNRGIKAMRESALDGTDYVIVRMRYNEIANRNCYLYHDGVMYMVTEFHRDMRDNIIQMKAVETTEKRVIVTPTTAADATGTVANDNDNNQGV